MNPFRNLLVCLCPALLLATGRVRAETVVWSDNFDTNAASRWSSTGVWKIGSPTAGPAVNAAGYRTHSGANCASTQGYGYSKDARLVCTRYNGGTSLLVPSADQFPRLRFWQWFNFNNALGYVEISTDAGTNWIQLSPTYLNLKSSGVWSRPSFDLSGYAGQRVRIAFHFTSGCCYGNGLGWFVDDVEVVTGTPIFYVPESFESGEGDWSVDSGTWEVGRPASGPGAAHTGTNCAATVLAGNYANNADSRLISPPFTVPASSPTLRFWQWYSFENALGYLEINNGTTSSSTVTNITITTNVTATLNTNTYQLFGAALAGYDTPFYWNPTIGAWTNETQVLGDVFDLSYQGYYFESGAAPFDSVGSASADYRGNIIPIPQSPAATNYPAWQGMTWTSITDPTDTPLGYFGTNYTYTYTTNISVSFSASSWQALSQTSIKSVGSTPVTSGGWVNTSVDLSAYAGQAVQIAFHFTSGGVYSAAGWYLDDITVATAPGLTVPTNQVVFFGQTLTNTLSATNALAPNSKFTFGLAARSTNAAVSASGGVTWTNTVAPPGTYVINVKVTDNQAPPFSVTNSFSVTVLPLPSQLILTSLAMPTNGGPKFVFAISTPWTNTAWRIVAATNLNGAATNWLPVYTNKTGAGTLLFTDRLATNFLQRYYRAVFP